MTIQDVFNLTSKQTVSVYALNGEPIVVMDLGYVTNYEFTDFTLVVTAQDLVLFIDKQNHTSKISKNSIVYVAAMHKFNDSKLLYSSSLGSL